MLSDANVAISPLCSYGRSGSTLLMRRLKEIGLFVSGPLPFEDRTAQTFFIAWMEALGSEEDALVKNETTAQFGNIPYCAYSLDDKPKGRRNDQKMSEWLTSVTHSGFKAVAEKFVGFDLLMLWHVYARSELFKPLYLVRDPRDIFVSVKQFNSRRGFVSFNETGDDAALFTAILDFTQSQIVLSKRCPGLVVRYEDLIARPAEATRSLEAFFSGFCVPLGAADAAAQAKPDVEKLHMTSDTQESSIGRWRNEVGLELFERHAKRLKDIGYD